MISTFKKPCRILFELLSIDYIFILNVGFFQFFLKVDTSKKSCSCYEFLFKAVCKRLIAACDIRNIQFAGVN